MVKKKKKKNTNLSTVGATPSIHAQVPAVLPTIAFASPMFNYQHSEKRDNILVLAQTVLKVNKDCCPFAGSTLQTPGLDYKQLLEKGNTFTYKTAQ